MTHIKDMSWSTAPEWATHIVGWDREDDNCHWAEKRKGSYFCAETRVDGAFPAYLVSFGMVRPGIKRKAFGWVVREVRPKAAPPVEG